MSHRLSRPLLIGPALFALLSLSLAVDGPARASSAPSPTSALVSAAPTPATNANDFVPTGAMSVRRSGATATLLGDGDVLVAGGGTATAELYHRASGTWSPTGSMSTARTDATATLLPNGDVLVAGGCCQPGNPYASLSSAELYDPTTGKWTLTGSMNKGRSQFTATLLSDGDVLVAGGSCNGSLSGPYGCDAGSFLVNQRTAELYDPATGTWTLTGSMRAGRALHTATLLPNGEVLVAGGFNSCDDDFCTDLSDAELYDPVTGKWLHTASMHAAREQQTATLLPDGDVLVAGGLNEGGGSGFATTYASAELYNPIFGTWKQTNRMNVARAGQAATLLRSGWVLVAGGGQATSEVYEPNSGIWVPTGNLSTVRTDQTATLLPNGNVLEAGGSGPGQTPLATADLFEAGVGPLVSLSAPALTFPTQQVGTTGNALAVTITNNGTGSLRVAGVEVSGADPSDFLASSACGASPVVPGASCTVLVRFSPVAPGLRAASVGVVDNAPLSPQAVKVSGYGAGPDVWVPTGSMSTARSSASTVVLPNGKVLVAGGENFSADATTATAELYDPGSGAFEPTGSMNQARAFGAVALLPDGDVLVAGGLSLGVNGESLVSSAELYHPSTGSWSLTAPLPTADDGLTATVLGNGLVLFTGFTGAAQELYDPTTATWSPTGPMPEANEGFGLAALLLSGHVLLAAGPNGDSAIYDPTTNTWSATASLGASRNGGSATVLQNGKVLVAGGLPGNGGSPYSTADLYDPVTATWTATGSLPAPRYDQSAVLLPNGTVLLAGGCANSCRNGAANDSYLYSEGFFSTTAALPATTIGQSAALLPDGDVLLAGGEQNDSADATVAADLYIPVLLSVTPSQGAPGAQITLTGNGFYAHEVVDVVLSGPSIPLLAQPTTDAKGQFTVKATVPSVPAGTYQLFARAQTSFAEAFTNFVVAKG
jgi:N-acetylneuraminic acid mutarotase